MLFQFPHICWASALYVVTCGDSPMGRREECVFSSVWVTVLYICWIYLLCDAINSRASPFSFRLGGLSIGDSWVLKSPTIAVWGSVCHFRPNLWNRLPCVWYMHVSDWNVCWWIFLEWAWSTPLYLFRLILVWNLFCQIWKYLHLVASWFCFPVNTSYPFALWKCLL